MFLLFLACVPKPPPPIPAVPAVPVAVAAAPETIATAAARLRENLARVHFDTDSSAITAQTRTLLAENAAILARHPIAVEVQGHADERGTIEYNLALGERRAAAVVDTMVLLGAPAARLVTVSYGEERPIAPGSGEVVWAENRRAEFRVLVDDSAVAGTVVADR